MDLEMLKERARIIRQVRSFFDNKGYLELDTPLLSPDLIPESCLEVFETRRILPGGKTVPHWLIPSPEIWMKKIIARHRVSVYQICKCFRNGESSGFLHSPEFTMLEYYTVGDGYRESLALTEELFASLGGPLFPPFERLTVAEAFARYADFDLFTAAETAKGMETEARRLGLDPMPGLSVAQLYDLIFIHAVEPQLKMFENTQEERILPQSTRREKKKMLRPLVLLDYPAFVPCLARRNPDGKTVERWELYFNGIELANCFSEETDAERVQEFFESEAAVKEQNALVKHRVDQDFWKIFLEKKFPQCSGVAMGLDRLIMALCGRSSIDGVLPFPEA
jgi:lysyl-tRNA synthetase class 2